MGLLPWGHPTSWYWSTVGHSSNALRPGPIAQSWRLDMVSCHASEIPQRRARYAPSNWDSWGRRIRASVCGRPDWIRGRWLFCGHYGGCGRGEDRRCRDKKSGQVSFINEGREGFTALPRGYTGYHPAAQPSSSLSAINPPTCASGLSGLPTA